jgi:hypothetical protein
MLLNEDQINEIVGMAELFFAPDDIAINIGVNPDEFKLELLNEKGLNGTNA